MLVAGDLVYPVGMSPEVVYRVREVSRFGQYRLQLFNHSLGEPVWHPRCNDIFMDDEEILERGWRVQECLPRQLFLF